MFGLFIINNNFFDKVLILWCMVQLPSFCPVFSVPLTFQPPIVIVIVKPTMENYPFFCLIQLHFMTCFFPSCFSKAVLPTDKIAIIIISFILHTLNWFNVTLNLHPWQGWKSKKKLRSRRLINLFLKFLLVIFFRRYNSQRLVLLRDMVIISYYDLKFQWN